MKQPTWHGRSVLACISLLNLAIFSADTALAQQSTVDDVTPRVAVPRKVEADNYLLYVAALRVAPEIIGGYLEREPTRAELAVLEEAQTKLDTIEARSSAFREQVCREYEAKAYEASSSDLMLYGDGFNAAEAMLKDDIVQLFEDTKSRLPVEAATALQSVKESMHGKSNAINWLEYAERAPERMARQATEICLAVLKEI